jgi:hypothetical protein
VAVPSTVASKPRVSLFSRAGVVLAALATVVLVVALLYQGYAHLSGHAPFPFEVSLAIAVGGPLLSTALTLLALVLRLVGRLRSGPTPKQHKPRGGRASRLPRLLDGLLNALDWLRRMLARFFIPVMLVASAAVSLAVEVPRLPLQQFAASLWTNCGATLVQAQQDVEQAQSAAGRDADFHASASQLAADMGSDASALDHDGATARAGIAPLGSLTPPLSKYQRIISLCQSELQIVARCIDPSQESAGGTICDPGAASPPNGLANGLAALLHHPGSASPTDVATALSTALSTLQHAPPAPALQCQYQELRADLTSLDPPTNVDTCP